MTLWAGYAASDITPLRHDCDLSGFAARVQPATELGEPVMARVVWLDDGKTKAVIAACDLLGFDLATSEALGTAIGQACGIKPGWVMLACTHTHSAPASMPLGLAGKVSRRYVTRVRKQLVIAAQQAKADANPMTACAFGRASAAGLGRFRCAMDLPGRDDWPGLVDVIRLERGNDKPIVLWRLGVHPYLLGFDSRVIHPDYPGVACDLLARREKVHAIYLPGCAGDVSPIPEMRTSLNTVNRYAGRVVKAVREALTKSHAFAAEPLTMGTAAPTVRFGFVAENIKSDDEDSDQQAIKALARASDTIARNHARWQRRRQRGELPTRSRFPLTGLRLGELVMMGMPAEIFHDTGADLQNRFDHPVLTLAQTGGNVGYLPRDFAFDHLTYEATEAFYWYGTAGALVPAVEAQVRRAAEKLIRRVMR